MLSDEITKARRGNITASEAHAIMTGWDAKEPVDDFPAEIFDWIKLNEKKPTVGVIKDAVKCGVTGKLIDAAWKMYQFQKPSQGLITYAETLACQELFYADPALQVSSQHMVNGNERELEATELLSKATGLNFVRTGDDQMHLSVNRIGATPDGLVYDDLDLIEAGGEVKCRSDLHHARQVFIEDNVTMMELDFARYCQMQVGCYVTEANRWYSASYNPLARVEGLEFNYCVIHRDDAFLDVFKQRAALTFEYKQMFMDKLMERAAKKEAA